jgi:hypothetical protein
VSDGDDGDVVPEQWELEVLEEHVAAIMFDSLERYEAGCVLCQRAEAAGLFDRFGGLGDDDGDEEELLDEAIVRHPAAGRQDDLSAPVPLWPEGPQWGPGGDSCA